MRRALFWLAGAIASGTLLALALPPSGVHVAGWVAFVPLFAAVRGRGFILGFLGGIVSCFVCAWLATAGLLYHGGSPSGLADWTRVGCFLFGCVIAFVAGMVGEIKKGGLGAAVVLAAVAVLLESLLLLVLPAHLALTQYRVPAMLWWSSLTGIWGVSFLLWGVNLLITYSLEDVRRNWKPVAGAVAVLLLAQIPTPRASGESRVRVAVVQTPSTEEADLARLNAKAAAQGARVAVWPEFSAQMLAPDGDTTLLRDISQREGQTAFVTSFRDDARPLPHNTAALFAAGTESRRYYKRKPFGGEVRMHAAGVAPTAATFGDLAVGLNVCYDSCFPYVMRDTANQVGRGLIAVPTIDPSSPYGFVESIHAAYTPFRAAELGMAVLRADGNVYSMIVAPDGRIVAELPPGVEDVAVAEVPISTGSTLYRMLGDWFLYLCGAIVLFALLRRLRRKPRTGAEEGRLEEVRESPDRELLLRATVRNRTAPPSPD